MSDFFIIDNKKTNNNSSTTEYYTVLGEQEYLNNKIPIVSSENKALAKKVIHNNELRFYIKVGLYGRPYNPIGMYTENQSNKFLTKAGKPAYTFKEVNEKVFMFYINFLSTKNIAWLHNTEREME